MPLASIMANGGVCSPILRLRLLSSTAIPSMSMDIPASLEAGAQATEETASIAANSKTARTMGLFSDPVFMVGTFSGVSGMLAPN